LRSAHEAAARAARVVKLMRKMQADSHMQSRERHRGADAQRSRQTCARASCCHVSLVGLVERPLGPFVEFVTGFRRCQPLGGTYEQLHAELIIELRNRFRCSRLADAQLTGGR
jgi:hypothetical protein